MIQFINKGGSSGEYNVKMNTTFTTENHMIVNQITEIPSNLDTSGVTDFQNMFSGLKLITTIPTIDTSYATTMQQMFLNCNNLITIPLLDTSKLSSRNSFVNIFMNCANLSNSSLNNILQMCANATTYNSKSYVKTLAHLGLSSEQATTCQGLSNYQAFLDAGWTTGY